MMNRKQLAELIHEFNLPCKEVVEEGKVCPLCFRIAGWVLLEQGRRLTAAGVEKE